MRARILILAAGALVLGLTACAQVVDGSGSAQDAATGPASSNAASGSGASSGADFPSGSVTSGASGTPAPTDSSTPPSSPTPSSSGPRIVGINPSCPKPVFGNAYLTYTCITSPMTGKLSAPPWSMVEFKTVEAKSRWAVQMGVAGPVSGGAGSLLTAATSIRDRMILQGDYGTGASPTSAPVQHVVVDGKAAVVLLTTIKINPAFAARVKTAVRTERLWVVAIAVQPNTIGLWHVTIPDIAKSLWPKVPSAIASIKVV